MQNLRTYPGKGAASERKAGWLTSGAPSPMTGCSRFTHKPLAHRRCKSKRSGSVAVSATPPCASPALATLRPSRSLFTGLLTLPADASRTFALTCLWAGTSLHTRAETGTCHGTNTVPRTGEHRYARHACLAHHEQVFLRALRLNKSGSPLEGLSSP